MLKNDYSSVEAAQQEPQTRGWISVSQNYLIMCVCVCVRWDNAVKVSVRLSRRGDRLRRRREPKKQLTGKGLAGFKWAFNLGPTTWFFASFWPRKCIESEKWFNSVWKRKKNSSFLNSFPVLAVAHLRAETKVAACPCLGQRSPWNGFNFVHSAALTGQASGSK